MLCSPTEATTTAVAPDGADDDDGSWFGTGPEWFFFDELDPAASDGIALTVGGRKLSGRGWLVLAVVVVAAVWVVRKGVTG